MIDEEAIMIIQAIPERIWNQMDKVEEEAIATIVEAAMKQIEIEVKIKDRTYYRDYFCPKCGKQQKDSFKNREKGCFCERCGQKIAPFSQ